MNFSRWDVRYLRHIWIVAPRVPAGDVFGFAHLFVLIPRWQAVYCCCCCWVVFLNEREKKKKNLIISNNFYVITINGNERRFCCCTYAQGAQVIKVKWQFNICLDITSIWISFLPFVVRAGCGWISKVGVAWADCFLVCRFYFLWHFLRFFHDTKEVLFLRCVSRAACSILGWGSRLPVQVRQAQSESLPSHMDVDLIQSTVQTSRNELEESRGPASQVCKSKTHT